MFPSYLKTSCFKAFRLFAIFSDCFVLLTIICFIYITKSFLILYRKDSKCRSHFIIKPYLFQSEFLLTILYMIYSANISLEQFNVLNNFGIPIYGIA